MFVLIGVCLSTGGGKGYSFGVLPSPRQYPNPHTGQWVSPEQTKDYTQDRAMSTPYHYPNPGQDQVEPLPPERKHSPTRRDRGPALPPPLMQGTPAMPTAMPPAPNGLHLAAVHLWLSSRRAFL